MTRLALTLTRPLVFLPGIALAVALASIAVLVMMPAPTAVAAVVVAPVVPLAGVMPAGSRDRRCDSCGYVEAIRRIDPVTGLSGYAFTVRMRDGSIRDSNQATRGRWLEGDQMMVIGGTAARALEQANNTAL
jgi:hypothetical protein